MLDVVGGRRCRSLDAAQRIRGTRGLPQMGKGAPIVAARRRRHARTQQAGAMGMATIVQAMVDIGAQTVVPSLAPNGHWARHSNTQNRIAVSVVAVAKARARRHQHRRRRLAVAGCGLPVDAPNSGLLTLPRGHVMLGARRIGMLVATKNNAWTCEKNDYDTWCGASDTIMHFNPLAPTPAPTQASAAYYPHPGLIGPKSAKLGTANCRSPEDCGKACDAHPQCISFGMSPRWAGGKRAQLYSTDYDVGSNNQQWTIYSRSSTGARRLLVV